MDQLRTEFVDGYDGARLAVHRLGAGRPLVLLHGLFSSAEVNWIKFGTAAKLGAAGFEAIMPDLRAHGQSAAPHDPAAYPPDVLVSDTLAVVEALGLSDFDLGGFSLGARTAVRAVLAGLTPGKLILGGMGLEGLAGWDRRARHFIDVIDRFGSITRDEPAYYAQAFMKTQKTDRVATRLLLQSVDDTSVAELAKVTMPTLVVCGADDRDNGDPHALVEALPNAEFAEIPGTHMSCVTRPELAAAMIGFLAAA